MIQLVSIRAENFMSFRELSLSLEDRGLIAVEGRNQTSASANSNGSGKSALYDAVYWILFGKSLRGLRLDDLIHEHHKEEGLTGTATLRDEKGTNYIVERYRGHKTQGSGLFFVRHSKAGPEDLRGADTRDTQKRIQRFLRMSPELFRQVVLFGEHGLNFAEMGDSQRKALLEEAMQIHVYVEAGQRVRSERSQIRSDLHAENVRLNEAHKRVSMTEGWVQKVHEQYKPNAAQETSLYSNMRDLESQVIAVDEEALNDRYDHVKDSLQRVTRAYQERLSDLKSQVRVLDHKAEEQRRHAEKIDALPFEEICPTCNQRVTKENAPDPRSLFEIAKQYQVQAAHAKQNVFNLQLAYESKSEEMRGELERLRAESEEHRSRVRSLQRLKQEAEVLEQNKSVYRNMLSEAEKNVLEAQNNLEQCESRIDSLSKRDALLKVLDRVFGVKGIRSFLFETSVPYFNQRLQHYAGIVSGGQIQARLDTTEEADDGTIKERISITVTTPSRTTTYKACSSGERRRLDLPIALALQDLANNHGVSLGLMLLDEVFEHVDSAGAEGVVSLLRYAKERPFTKTVLSISHDEELVRHFNQTLTVSKENDSSSLWEERT